MLNPKCPNCYFALVLLEKRLKYRCSKCSKLFPQKQVEAISFRIWNKKQRELDLHNLKLEPIKKRISSRRKLSSEQKRAKSRLYHANNSSKINELKRTRWRANKEEINLKRRLKRSNNRELTRLLNRIEYFRARQKELALQGSKNKQYKASSSKIPHSVATYAPSQLLGQQ
ncbi:MAG: hypothetical protein ABIB47_05110 [Candidatus Woesearchaeota archaeon]